MASLEINNLGKFADMSAVWSTHPEGGREGDFLTIGQTKFRWNVYKRSWVPAGETTPGGSASETIDGDLTVGGDLHVVGEAEIEGDVTINGELHLPNGDRYKGQSSYKSIVFTRADERPVAPTGGSYANPLPDGNVWKDGVPQGNKPIWMSSRVFTSDGKAPQASSWSTPSLMSDTENIDVEFSPQPTNTNPVPPIEGPNGNLGWLWFDPVRNASSGIDWSKMNWMATRTKSVSSNGAAVWSDWTIILIKGEAGDGVQSVFTVTDGSTPSISGSSYPPSGWYKSVDSLTVGQGDVLWMSERRFENGAWSAWSAPVRLNGVDGLPGEDGSDIEFIYKRMNRLPNTGGNVDSTPESTDVDGAVPATWENHPSGVDATHLYEWSCQRTKSGGTWGPWVGPFVWSAWGEKGMDGDGVEYVFKLTEDNDAPGTPSTSDGTVNPVTGEFIPTGWTDGPTGVSKSMPYEWVSQRKRINGTWGSFTTPALWATFSEEHTVDINEFGYWVIDGVPTDKMAIGTGVTIKGRVDVYRDSEITDSETSLESYPSSLTGDNALEIGDCWIVETGTDANDQDVSGHLFICVATSGTLASMWKDLGEFKGEPGESSYLHIAWAQNVTFNPLVVSNPTTNPSVGRTYDWMGIKVTKTDTVPAWTQFKWNYLRGKDGMDVEYVYIRTKTNVPPTITEAAVQTPERYPDVANYNSSYAAGDIENDTFQDDPNGVSEDWPYEWMSRREKVNGEWGQFLSPARLWSNWADQGEPGESQPWVKTEVAQIVVDADAEGKIASRRDITLKCWLYVGKDRVTPILSRCSATYGGSAVNLGQQAINPADPYITVSVSLLANTALATKDIAVTLANVNASASTTVPVIINKAGADGRDVYKSIVFMRSASKPTKPGSNDGDYYNPVPSGTYNDGGVTRQWSDGVDAGTLPVWMTSRIFSSDNQSPPQESAWSDVVLMQDVANAYDVEFTDASTESSPGTPDNPATGVTWYDPVDDASYLSSHAMNWMAQRVKVVTANGTGWSNWVVNRIRGEKGNDGAGQAYIETSMDQIIVDCGSDGKPKVAATETFTAALKFGDDTCELNGQHNGASYSGAGSLSTDLDESLLEIEFDYSTNAVLQSGLITIYLTGIDSNNVEHTATKTVPVIANVQGDKGKTGSVLRFRGVWSDSEYYVYNDTFRDCVKYNGRYYIMSDYTYGLPGMQTNEPDSDTQSWDNIGNMQFVATELLLAEQGTIQNLISDYIRTAATGPRVEMYGNVARFFGTGSKPNIEMMVDADGVAYLRFYDKDGNMLYDLGPRGINWLRSTVIPARFAQTYTQYVKMVNNEPDKSTSTTGQAYLYQFNAQRSNGVIEADDNYASTAAVAATADGKYFVYNNVRIENNQLANGLFRASSAPIITYSSAERAGDVQGMQAELANTYGLSQSQINNFDWTVGGALDTLVKAIKMQNYVSFSGGVMTNKIAIWQENNSNASFLVDAV